MTREEIITEILKIGDREGQYVSHMKRLLEIGQHIMQEQARDNARLKELEAQLRELETKHTIH
jgi:hypothetical protein